MLQGRVALVTGAGRGIGRATALALAGQGARVMAVARTAPELESLAAEAPVAWLATSLESEDGCTEVIRETRSRLGPIEILVNNASIGSVYDETIFDLPPRRGGASSRSTSRPRSSSPVRRATTCASAGGGGSSWSRRRAA